ncbi:MAG: tRNA (guanosine(46)-N7)-methyltransferase TrmB [Paludibacteraceae bacterium]|nr:tRNA (guanosine(46)-N7)-methyltransferase TrmB [Paludibacteraceae bacterium]
MSKNKQKKFQEMNSFARVFQCAFRDIQNGSDVTLMAGHWDERVFRNGLPITLELGCGHGDYTIGLARQDSARNFIGVDIKGARMWAGAKQAEDENMANVAFLRTQIELLPRFFAADEVDEIWITFPDPQMKKATKRLTSTFFMKRYQQVVRPDGLIHLKTDSPFLYTYTRAMLRENGYPVLADTADLYAAADAPSLDKAKSLQTHYEKQWLDRGLTIKYLCWQLQPKTVLREPDIEIEKDTYRSYGRDYQTKNQKQ